MRISVSPTFMKSEDVEIPNGTLLSDLKLPSGPVVVVPDEGGFNQRFEPPPHYLLHEGDFVMVVPERIMVCRCADNLAYHHDREWVVWQAFEKALESHQDCLEERCFCHEARKTVNRFFPAGREGGEGNVSDSDP